MIIIMMNDDNNKIIISVTNDSVDEVKVSGIYCDNI